MLKNILGFVFFWFWLVLALYLMLGVYFVFNNTIANESEYFLYILIGGGSYLFSLFIIKPYRYRFWDTFFHELSHTLFAFLTGAKVNKFVVSIDSLSSQNGFVEYQFKTSKIMGFIRSHLVSLAPYYFSPLTVMMMIIYYTTLPSNNDFYSDLPILNGLLFMIGFFYVYHLRASISQAKPYQTDFNSVGYFYGLSFVFFMQSFFLLQFVTILAYNFEGYYYFLEFIYRMLL
ncbi:M50 family metallopeptidase [Sulfurimonas sp.]